MKVTEICGYPTSQGYKVYYHTKINDRIVLIERNIILHIKTVVPNILGYLYDGIQVFDYGFEKELFEKDVQVFLESQKESKIEDEVLDINPFDIKYGKEINLSLSNIIIEKPVDHIDIDSYQYMINKKTEELILDRSLQFKQRSKDNPDLYCIEKYLEKFEKKYGKKLSEIEKQKIKRFDQIMFHKLMIGKYNLEDYLAFLEAIPDLLSKRKILAIGHFDLDGLFWTHGNVLEVPSAEEISQYNTYGYRTIKRRCRIRRR